MNLSRTIRKNQIKMHNSKSRAKKLKQKLLFVGQKQMPILNKMKKELNDDNENHNKDSEYLFATLIPCCVYRASSNSRW